MSNSRRVYSDHARAFTLVELMVVVLILGALAFVAIPRIGNSATTAKVQSCESNVVLMNRLVELYYTKKGDWPQNYNKFCNDTDYFPDGPPECPFGTNYSMDGGDHHINPHSH
ncbi:MAG: prepilin-type N-terminal cleavage/methylation domain-containing protein [Planctomycetes bacterium]|nr:prepilin-type N-terminal cleavage/methylation domain-containing protein [Planctomycetota bacterium]